MNVAALVVEFRGTEVEWSFLTFYQRLHFTFIHKFLTFHRMAQLKVEHVHPYFHTCCVSAVVDEKQIMSDDSKIMGP